MSGPVTAQDAAPDPAAGRPHAPEVEVLPSRETTVGGVPVRRALPKRQRRTVGAWCFADHFGPVAASGGEQDMQIGPHPHAGLHTVTWLVEGELVHRDSLGSEQPIRPGQLNLMTAGHGVAHAEESPPALAGRQHGIQLWVAQPEATRHGPAAFEHHADLPRLDLGGAVATVLVGGLDGVVGADSPARRDSPLLGVDLDAGGRGGTVALPLRPGHEHAVVVLDGSVGVGGIVGVGGAAGAGDGGDRIGPGVLAYLGEGRDELEVDLAPGARVILLGGAPFGEQIVMAWNFVGRSREELDRAAADWNAGDERFGRVDSRLPRIPAP